MENRRTAAPRTEARSSDQQLSEEDVRIVPFSRRRYVHGGAESRELSSKTMERRPQHSEAVGVSVVEEILRRCIERDFSLQQADDPIRHHELIRTMRDVNDGRLRFRAVGMESFEEEGTRRRIEP